uniref:Uncharacterized protein n=1 Tax=Anguilla anguilla TaxID=7936 RepID=A0A0E9SIS8_ANGAN
MHALAAWSLRPIDITKCWGDALPGLHCSHLQLLHVLWASFIQFSVYRISMFSWIQFLALRNSSAALAVCLGSLSCYRVKCLEFEQRRGLCILQNSFCCYQQVHHQ